MTDKLTVPTGLTRKGRTAAKAILAFLKERKADNTGGCRAFYTPDEWAERGETYGTESLLVVVHDGGDHAPYFNLDYCAYEAWEAMNAHLRKHGVYAEQCTCWYTAIYPI